MKVVIDTDADDLEAALEILKNAYENIGDTQLDIMPLDEAIQKITGRDRVFAVCIRIAHENGFIFAQENPMANVKFITSGEFCDLGFNLDKKYGGNPFMQNVTVRKVIEACNRGGFEMGYRGAFIDLYGKRQALYDKAKENAARQMVAEKKMIKNEDAGGS